MHSLVGTTADEVWRGAATLFLPDGPARLQGSRGGDTYELLHVVISISDPRQRWVVSRTPAINPAFALVEVFWIAAGLNCASLPNYWNPALPKFGGNSPTYHGAYGYRLRRHFGIDQLDRVYRALDSNPDTRQAVLQLWDASSDLPDDNGTTANTDIPCNVIGLLKVRANRLDWTQVMRSNDLFRGLPHNFVQFTSLQEMVSGWLGIEIGSYHHLSDSLHVYSRDVGDVRASVRTVPHDPSTASFALERKAWDRVIKDVIHLMGEMASSDLTPIRLRELARAADLPQAYADAVRVIAADTARRRGWEDVARWCAEACTNSLLRGLWSRWAVRKGHAMAEVDRRP
jgi:thymidylate synthase